MTINFWGLGLQALNVLILMWLLSRIFWRPVSAAITRRQDAAQSILDAANAVQDKAEAALAEVAETRAGIGAERDTALAAAKEAADAAAKTVLVNMQIKADALLTAARTTIKRDTDAAHKERAIQTSVLSVAIAARLLTRFNSPMIQDAFLALLISAIAKMSVSDRAALVATAPDIEIVTATDPKITDKKRIESAVTNALGGAPKLRFVTNPDLVAGLELRSAHFVLHNSWQADLEKVLKELNDAAQGT